MGENDPHDFLLCNKPRVHVSRYRQMRKAGDRDGLADFLRGRFEERYLGTSGKDLLAPSALTRGASGFTTAANCCLLIEALEAFRQGWPPNTRSGREAFRKFFARHVGIGLPPDEVWCEKGRGVNCPCFYHGIRCAILHSGETTGGWRLHTHADVTLDRHQRILNPNKLREVIRKDLNKYADQLRNTPWQPKDPANAWHKFLHRMEWSLRHCKWTPMGGEAGPV